MSWYAMDRSGSRLGRRAGRVVAPLLAGLLVAVAPEAAGAQAVRLGVVMDTPREMLARLWTEDARQVERAYCVVQWSYGVYQVTKDPPVKTDTIFRVFGVKDAPVTNAGPSSIEFECPPGVPEMHTHTPTTCTGDDVRTCTTGGLNAYSCQPSRQDLEKLIARGDPFGIIQCDRRSYRFYYPHEYGMPVQTLSQRAGDTRPKARLSARPGGRQIDP